VTPQSHPPVTRPVTLEAQTCDSPVTQGVEVKEGREGENHRSDDAVFRSPLEQAKQRLLKTNPPEESPYIGYGLEVIEHRAHDLGIKPRTARYFLTAYENLKTSEKDWTLVDWYVKNPAAAEHRQKINALIIVAERESERTGKPVIDIFHTLRQNPRWHEEMRANHV
jgi:hypothetical protein